MCSPSTEAARWMRGLLLALALATGCAVGAPEFTCDECTADQVCWEAEMECTDLCVDRTTCKEGHACIVVDQQVACDVRCDPALCAPDVCSSDFGSCIAVECSATRACATPGDGCDQINRECYPVNGDCSEDPCYQFSAVSPVADVTCGADNFCHLEPLPMPPPWLDSFDPSPDLALSAPAPGQSFAAASDVELSWADPGTSVIAYILAAIPQNARSVAMAAIWGIAVPADGSPSAQLADGSAIVGGVWTADPVTLPVDQPLYAFVFTLSHGEVKHLSMLVPFRIAGAWAKLGDVCEGATHLPDDCFNPGAVQACRDRRCRRVCASHVDCADLGLACAEAVAGVRICE